MQAGAGRAHGRQADCCATAAFLCRFCAAYSSVRRTAPWRCAQLRYRHTNTAFAQHVLRRALRSAARQMPSAATARSARAHENTPRPQPRFSLPPATPA